jgi:hypothetical protein
VVKGLEAGSAWDELRNLGIALTAPKAMRPVGSRTRSAV